MTEAPRRASDLVRELIERDGVVRHGLARGLVNVRALARSIEAEAEGAASFDAILGAIRRYPFKAASARRGGVGKHILKLSVKNRIAVVLIRNRPELQQPIAHFAGELSPARGDTFRIVSGLEAVSVTVDSRNLAKLESRIPRQDILRRLGNLAQVDIEIEHDIEKIPGVLATITTELAVNDVNVVQLTTVGPGRVILLVEEADVTRAYRALDDLSHEKP